MRTFLRRVFVSFILVAPSLVAQTNATKQPPIPEEARKHFVKGTTFLNDAKTAGEFVQAESEFKQAADLAPEWPEARYSLALAKEAAGDYSGAMADLKLYQKFTLSDTQARTVQDKIYALEAKSEEAAKRQAAEQRIKDLYGARWRYTWPSNDYVDGYTEVVYSGTTLVATEYWTRDTWSKVSSVGRPYVGWTLPFDGSLLGKTLPLPIVDQCSNCGPYLLTVSEDGQRVTMTCGRSDICGGKYPDPTIYYRK